MIKQRAPSPSRRRFLGTFSALVSTVPWLFGPSDADAAKRRVKGVLTEIETDALIRSTPKRTVGFLCRDEGGSSVLMDGHRIEPVCRINKTGRLIWRLCDGTRNPHQISQILSRVYDVDPHQAYVDCLCFLATLRKRGAIDG